ncbi:hypothetical protein MXD81_27280, partial [Microbacteriaceae bacterium K1510]|nr:hypothetical protein [Microbacteriaceae bacterium K1510]
ICDKEKKQSRSKRRLIGRVDERTGEIVPTKGTNKRESQAETVTPRRGPVPSTETARYFYGATHLLDAIGDKLGIVSD